MKPPPTIADCRRDLADAEALVAELIRRRIQRDRSVHRSHFEAAARYVLAARVALRIAEERGARLEPRSGWFTASRR